MLNTCTMSCSVGVPDGSPGSLNSAYGVASGPNGDIFVSETGLVTRVSVFGSDGTYKRSFGAAGSAAGQLKEIFSVGVDPTGTAYVPENGNKRVSSFDPAGAFLNARGFDVIWFPPAAPSCAPPPPPARRATWISASAPSWKRARSASIAACSCHIVVVRSVEKLREPGSRVPPCPSNAFSFGKTKKSKKKGTLTVDVTVPAPDARRQHRKKALRQSATATAARVVRITVKAPQRRQSAETQAS